MGNWFALNAPPAASPRRPGAVPSPVAGDWFAQNAPQTQAATPAQPDGLLSRAYAAAKRMASGVVEGVENYADYAGSHPVADTAAQTGIGAAKGAGHTGLGITSLMLPSWLGRPAAQPEALKPANAAQSGGFGAEQAAEYLVPGSRAEKAVDAVHAAIEGADALKGAGMIARATRGAAKLGTEAAIKGATDAAVAKAQGGPALATGLVGGAVPILGSPFGKLASAVKRGVVGDLTHAATAGAPTAADLAEHAAAEGIPATAAQITGAPVLEKVQKVGENSLLSGAHVAKRLSDVTSALQNSANRFMDGIAPANSREAAGMATREALAGGVDSEKNRIADLFDQVDSLSDGVGVAPDNMRQIADEVVAKGERGLKGASPTTAVKVAKDILAKTSKGETVPWGTAQYWRSQLLDASNFPKNDLPESQTLLRRLAGAVHQDMKASSNGLSEPLYDKFLEANAAHRLLEKDLGNSLIGQVLRSSNGGLPATSVNAVLTSGAGGGERGVLNRVLYYLRNAAPDDGAVNAFRRDFVQRLGDPGSGTYDLASPAKNLKPYSDEYLKDIMGDASKAQWLRRHAALASNAVKNINPSGTAQVAQMVGEIGLLGTAARLSPAALTFPAATAAAGRIATSPRLTKWVLKGIGAPAPEGMLARAVNAASAAAAAHENQ